MDTKLKTIDDLSKEELRSLVDDLAKRWLAHDGVWFQAIEAKRGMDEAIEMDIKAWERFTVLEATRIKTMLNLPERSGLQGLAQALQFRLYAVLNEQTLEWHGENKLVFSMVNCRVQAARERKKMDAFPCRPVGIVEYSGFARTIDDRIQTRCLSCPPERVDDQAYCVWEFTLEP
ncbi:DUF6125 family protein [Heliophilum fasciatum]|uniref:Cytosolic protein n=1 Tax=Heliophilum fasciatum TaxID=35700 RepID=A0A4R2S116_9FIRM|nr:DUF6125 family protein [Heliophilum fasciatum]MCW2276722.1 hypothetical protein [Heliophilum fasciatum]TCP68897.1 hypothetical protein EDD73_10163 [Heliophilum fasciatum]